jgi:L-ascorbate metabolism protein UlaG (beta-lactamase superfamily)
MYRLITLFLFVSVTSRLYSVDGDKIQFFPVKHASFVIQKGDITIFIDPVGDIENYKIFPSPQLIIITHAHGDHFDKNLLVEIKSDQSLLVAPKSVTEQLGYGNSLNNGEKTTLFNIETEAVPMYNTTPERLMFHPKGVGNGYVLTLGNERIYISGDTEDIPEMRALKNIDYAFICMNLPYTMTIEQAASAILEFKPKHVYPYHYRMKDGITNIEKFKDLVSVNPEIEVIFLKWYE